MFGGMTFCLAGLTKIEITSQTKALQAFASLWQDHSDLQNAYPVFFTS